jgi:hypothetical protein
VIQRDLTLGHVLDCLGNVQCFRLLSEAKAEFVISEVGHRAVTRTVATTLMMEAAGSFETSVATYISICYHNPEYQNLGVIKCSMFYEKLRLWSSGQSFWLQSQRSRVRFLALRNFLSSCGTGTGYTQLREDK